jgi:hypothetical protein
MAHALRLPNFGMGRPLRREEEYNRRQWSEVRGLQTPAWLKEVYDRISALAELEENWDSHGGLPVASGAISETRILLSNLAIEELPKPHVAPIPDGSVGLHWRVGGRDLEIEIEASGPVHYLKTYVGCDSIEDGDVHSLKDAQDALDWVLGR